MSIFHTSTDPVPRRHLTDRQREFVDRLVAAAASEVEEKGYDEITVRSIAKRAEIAPATAYTYFSSKDHLLAELFWRRTQSLAPPLVDLGRPVTERVADVVREILLGTTDSPALVSACTAALLGNGPDVDRVRLHIGSEIRRRLGSALGPGGEQEVLDVLEITYIGALLTAGMGYLRFDDLPQQMAVAAGLLTRGAA